MDKLSKIGLALTVLALVGWFYWQGQQAKKAPPQPTVETEIEPRPAKPAAPVKVAAPSAAVERDAVETEPVAVEETSIPLSHSPVKLETDLMEIELNPLGGVIQKLVLKENPAGGIRKLPDEETGAVTLFSADNLDLAPGRFVNFQPALMEVKSSASGVEFLHRFENNLLLIKNYTFDEESYTARLRITIRNESADPLLWEDGLVFSCGAIRPIDPQDLLGVDVLPVGGKIIREKAEKEATAEKIDWLGLKTKYFAAIFKPLDRSGSSFSVEGKKKKSQTKKAIIGCARGPGASPYEYLKAEMGFERMTIEPGGEAEYSFLLYLGPADYKFLKETGYGFEEIVDLGFLRPICIGIIWLLDKIHGAIGSFGWSIIVLTIIIKIVLWPLTHKSYASMGKMQKLQPQLAVLKEKYKSDSKKIQAETMKLYKENGVNPMGGCLPMLLQMPILFALFTTLRNTILLRKAPFWIIPGKWIQDLSGPDVLMTLGKSYPIIGNQLNILPLLMGLSFYLQQKFTPTAGGGTAQAAQQQKMMSTMMPILFTFMFYTLPAGLNLYFMLSTFITVAQQLMVTKRD